ncbi:MAG TPA: hypothetical protein VFE51_08280 [Verrucomicrobiae bacterium]|nr:hypothetical protein [Verrucomicrobiae bacterium]
MSLINDALKRARQAHQENPAPPVRVPDLRPVEPEPQPVQSMPGLFVPIGLALLAIAGLCLFWVLWKRQSPAATAGSAAPITVEARTAGGPVKPGDQAVGAAVPTSPPASVGNPLTVTEPLATAANSNYQSGSATNQNPTAQDVATTNHVAAAEPAQPSSPPPLKLQSIVFNPRNPSALINGRVVFQGDRVRDFRVKAIHRDNVVLVASGNTNVLSLEP